MHKYQLVVLMVLVAVFAVVPVCAADTADVVIDASLDHESARVGDIVRLRLDYTLPAGAVFLEKETIESLGGITVIDSQAREGRLDAGILVDSLDGIEIRLEMHYRDASGETGVLESGPLSLEVRTDPEKELELEPIRDIIPGMSAWVKALIVVLAALGIAALVWLAVWLVRWRRKGVAAAPLEAPGARAGRKLVELEASDCNDKEFWFEFSAVMREYIAGTRGVPALEMTIDELRKELAKPVDRDFLKVLERGELVKFADAVSDMRSEEIELARSYVAATTVVGETGGEG